MTEPLTTSSMTRLVTSLDEIDTEIARLAQLCQVRILDPGVVDRVLHRDDSVCGTSNPVAFHKLHDMLVMHFGVRGHAGAAHGQTPVSVVEQHVIDRLRDRFPALSERWPASGI